MLAVRPGPPGPARGERDGEEVRRHPHAPERVLVRTPFVLRRAGYGHPSSVYGCPGHDDGAPRPRDDINHLTASRSGQPGLPRGHPQRSPSGLIRTTAPSLVRQKALAPCGWPGGGCGGGPPGGCQAIIQSPPLAVIRSSPPSGAIRPSTATAPGGRGRTRRSRHQAARPRPPARSGQPPRSPDARGPPRRARCPSARAPSRR